MTLGAAIGDPHAVAQSGQGGAVIYYPGGFDIENFALAVPQATIGTVFGTRAVVRWISVDVGNTDLGKFDLFGIGVQHSISQYVPVLPIDVAAGSATSLSSTSTCCSGTRRRRRSGSSRSSS